MSANPHDKPAEKFGWLTNKEIVKSDIDDLRAAYNEIIANMTDKQVKLVTNMLNGMSDAESARQAGYSTNDHNPGWRARKGRKVVFALAVGREIASRGAETTPELIRTELKNMLEKAKADDDRVTFINCIRELCKIDGAYSEQQLKLMHAAHDGSALQKEVSDDEFELLSHLYHRIREDETTTH